MQAARDAWLKCFKDVLKEDEEKNATKPCVRFEATATETEGAASGAAAGAAGTKKTHDIDLIVDCFVSSPLED